MLGKKIINTGGGVACTTDTTQILDGGTTQSTALYRFEDNANDTASSTGKFNKGGVFNGTNSAIDLPTGDLGIGTNDFSVSLWFNCADITQNDQSLFWFQHYQSPIRIGAALSQSAYGGDGDVRFYCTISGTGTNANSNSDIFSSNTWYHIVFVKSSTSGMAVYVNGSSTPVATNTGATGAVNNNISSNGKNTIGTYTSSTAHLLFFNGKIDQFRTFNKALSTSEIATLYNETTTTVNTLQVLGDYSCISTYTFEGNANDLNTSTPKNGTATNVIYDYSGTASNVTYAAGKFDKAAVFNGSNGYITTGLTLPANSTMSFSFWFYKDSSQVITGDTYMLSDLNSSASHRRIDIRYNTGTDLIFIDIGNGSSSSQTSTGYTPPSDTWTHLAVTLNGTAVKMYINGNSTPVADYTSSVAFGTAGVDALALGRPGAYNCCYFKGKLDQVRIFNKTLSPGEVNSLYNETTTTAALGTIIDPSTIAYYKMADATDETDSYNGTATDVDFNVVGKYGFAGLFNGSSSRINTGLIWPGGTQISWSFWVNTAGGVNQYFFGDFNSTGTTLQGRFAAQFHNSNVLYIITTNGSTSTTTNAGSITSYLNKWTHVVITANGTEVKAYLDGALFNTHTGTAITAGAHPFVIGAYTDGSSKQNVNGRMDQVRIFNKAISAAEVTTLYNEIQCANTITAPESYFNSVLYTGNNTSRSITTTFQPDFVWLKSRGSARDHRLFDSIRGATKGLYSNLSNAEFTESSLTAFNTNGFTLGTAGNQNVSSENYVSWAWKAASSNTTNNDGTITSTVRASQESGFSIVKYTGNGSNGATVGHGLLNIPNLWIIKQTTGTQNWLVGSSSLSAPDRYLILDGENAELTNAPNIWSVSSSTITFPTSYAGTNNNTSTYIGYFFHNVDGYQRIGTFTGNGNANGPFVYTGFEPAWVLIKKISSGSPTGGWVILDNKRNPVNPRNSRISAQSSGAENTNNAFSHNFYSNGFQVVTSDVDYNHNGKDYLFWAIAANPDTSAPTKANSFKTKIYTGNGGTQSITGVGFKPDFTWIKSRDTADNNNLGDSVRGVQKFIYSNLTSQELTSANYLTSFDADGFSVGSDNSINKSSDSIVSWNWKALDHDRNLASINTDGTIPSLVSVNRAAGFSIIKYVGNATSGASIGHGLGVKPDLVIFKNIDQGGNYHWSVYSNTSATGATGLLYLNLNDAFTTTSSRFNNTEPTTSVITLGNDGTINNSGNNHIAYCWHSVSGHSSIGSYNGNGSATGTIVTTGFEPSWVILKCTNTNGTNWRIIDNVRDTTNPRSAYLNADTNSAEETAYDQVNFLANGFQLATTDTSINGNGNPHIYMAFK